MKESYREMKEEVDKVIKLDNLIRHKKLVEIQEMILKRKKKYQE